MPENRTGESTPATEPALPDVAQHKPRCRLNECDVPRDGRARVINELTGEEIIQTGPGGWLNY